MYFQKSRLTVKMAAQTGYWSLLDAEWVSWGTKHNTCLLRNHRGSRWQSLRQLLFLPDNNSLLLFEPKTWFRGLVSFQHPQPNSWTVLEVTLSFPWQDCLIQPGRVAVTLPAQCPIGSPRGVSELLWLHLQTQGRQWGWSGWQIPQWRFQSRRYRWQGSHLGSRHEADSLCHMAYQWVSERLSHCKIRTPDKEEVV